MNKENRQFERYAFPADRKINASMKLANGGGSVQVRILNISGGGLGLAADRRNQEKLEQDIELYLEMVKGETELNGILGKTVKVKWVLDYEPLENLGVGCEFVNMDEEGLKDINNLLKG